MASLALARPSTSTPLRAALSSVARVFFAAPSPAASSPAASSSSTTSTSAAPLLSALSLPALPSLPTLAGLAGLLELLPPILWAVPKHKTTHSRKSMRSANKGIKNKTNFNHCNGCGTLKLTHNLCPTCYSQISRRWKEEARSPSAEQK